MDRGGVQGGFFFSNRHFNEAMFFQSKTTDCPRERKGKKEKNALFIQIPVCRRGANTLCNADSGKRQKLQLLDLGLSALHYQNSVCTRSCFTKCLCIPSYSPDLSKPVYINANFCTSLCKAGTECQPYKQKFSVMAAQVIMTARVPSRAHFALLKSGKDEYSVFTRIDRHLRITSSRMSTWKQRM